VGGVAVAGEGLLVERVAEGACGMRGKERVGSYSNSDSSTQQSRPRVNGHGALSLGERKRHMVKNSMVRKKFDYSRVSVILKLTKTSLKSAPMVLTTRGRVKWSKVLLHRR
jgi:hypothetical protein